MNETLTCSFNLARESPTLFLHDEEKASVTDPDPGSGSFLTPGSGMEKNPEPGSGIRDEHPGSYF